MTTKEKQLNSQNHEIRNIVEKIVANAGIGKLSAQPNFEKALPQIEKDLAAITGQKFQVTRARKSIAAFKTREGQVIGLRTTLRGQKMVDFLERLVRIVLPRVHDFRGLNEAAIDEGGVLNIGFREQDVFPEINAEESTLSFSLGVNIVPKEKDRAKAIQAYKDLGFPFKK